jgi:hypothetical protein
MLHKNKICLAKKKQKIYKPCINNNINNVNIIGKHIYNNEQKTMEGVNKQHICSIINDNIISIYFNTPVYPNIFINFLLYIHDIIINNKFNGIIIYSMYYINAILNKIFNHKIILRNNYLCDDKCNNKNIYNDILHIPNDKFYIHNNNVCIFLKSKNDINDISNIINKIISNNIHIYFVGLSLTNSINKHIFEFENNSKYIHILNDIFDELYAIYKSTLLISSNSKYIKYINLIFNPRVFILNNNIKIQEKNIYITLNI